MAHVVEQSNSGNTVAATPTTVDATLGSDTTAGNKVIIVVSSDATVSTPTNFTLDRSQVNFNGHYVFAGAANDTAPFALESGGMGQSECVAYRGDDAHIELAVGPGLLIATNEPGSAVFVGQRPSETSAFEALIELRDLLRDPDALGEGEIVSRISDHISAISQAHERVTDGAIRLGWRSAQLEASRVSLENAELADQELLSELEDADFAAAAARLYGQELALEAALLVSRRMLGHTLLEYL